jgi:hypothetical protein
MHDAADDSTVIDPRFAANVRGKKRLDPPPLLIVQPKQAPPHHRPRITSEKANHQPIHATMALLGFSPRASDIQV